MKTKSRIKIIADKPAPGQTSIAHLIGQEFEVISRDEENGSVTIHSPDHEGHIVIQKEEYRVL